MKTPLEKLIEYCEKCEKASSIPLVKILMDGIVDKATSLLIEEKQGIVDAYKEGWSNGYLTVDEETLTGEDYFNKTYKP